MSDLISRQKVIDEITRLINEKHNIKIGTSSFRDGVVDGYARVRSMIESYPSAQPKSASCKQVTGKLDLINRQDAVDAIVKLTNCNTPKVLREYVAEHSLWSLWSGGVLEALDAVEGLPSAPLYTPDEIQTMQDMEWAQLEKMYELGKEERKKGKWELLTDERFDIDYYKCSECGYEPYRKMDISNFCPNCGADMRGDSDE